MKKYILIGPYPPPLGGISVFIYRYAKVLEKDGYDDIGRQLTYSNKFGAKMREIIYHCGNLAGIPYYNAKALRMRGLDAVSVKPFEFDNLGIKNGKHGNRQLPTDITISQSSNLFIQKIDYLRFFGKNFSQIRLMHYYGGCLLPLRLDVKACSSYRVPMAISWGGTDTRVIGEARKNNPYFHLEPNEEYDSRIKTYLTQISKYIKCVIADVEMAEYSKPYFEQVFVVKQPLDLDAINYNADYEFAREPATTPVVLHIPTRTEIKGTSLIVKAVERLKKEGMSFEFRLLNPTLSQAEVKEEISRCDIYVDELKCGSYGMTAVEGLGCGKPTLTYIREDLVDKFPVDLPIVNANPDTIYDKLKELIEDGRLRHQVGLSSRAYAEKYHSLKAVGQQLIESYRAMGVSLD